MTNNPKTEERGREGRREGGREGEREREAYTCTLTSCNVPVAIL